MPHMIDRLIKSIIKNMNKQISDMAWPEDNGL